jgi:hypothetical protein
MPSELRIKNDTVYVTTTEVDETSADCIYFTIKIFSVAEDMKLVFEVTEQFKEAMKRVIAYMRRDMRLTYNKL